MRKFFSFALAILMVFSLVACGNNMGTSNTPAPTGQVETNSPTDTLETLAPVTKDEYPKLFKDFEPLMRVSNYDSEPFMLINDGIPFFTATEKETTDVFETYSELDALGRCGVAYANLCKELMPTEERESLSSVTPSGWNNKKYDFVDGGWIYNRAHIIGFQLAGEQANELNLMTGTRYFNVDGMLTFENMVADYIKEKNNHVLYRVTPVYVNDNLVAEGVLIEAWSVEDYGEGICINAFCFNVQPGVTIDYATGDNWETNNKDNETIENTETKHYVLNTNSKKFHLDTCSSVADMSEKNKEEIDTTRDNLISKGYSPCGICKP